MKYKIYKIVWVNVNESLVNFFVELEVVGRENLFSSVTEATKYITSIKDDLMMIELTILPYIKIN